MNNTKIEYLLTKKMELREEQYSYGCYGLCPEKYYSRWEKLSNSLIVYEPPRYSGSGFSQTKVILTVKRNIVAFSKMHCAILKIKAKSGNAGCNVSGKGRYIFSDSEYTELDLSENFNSTNGDIKIEITAMEKENPVEFDPAIPICLDLLYETDTEPQVSDLELALAPKKTIYLSGSIFDGAGAVIKVNYTDGSWRYSEKFTTSINKLTVQDKQGKIEYKQKTLNVPITVENCPYNVVNAKSNANGVYFDNPKIDLKTGKLIFVNPDLSIGENSYEIGVSHVYHSQTDDVYDKVFMSCGKGWKLNLEQYLVKSDDGKNYKLIDDMGYTHVFEKFDGNRYYDVNDAGTVLIDESDGALITDAKGNKIKFNLSGKIAYTQAALNDKIKKIFEYNNGRIVSVYDTRRKKYGPAFKGIEFTYNQKGQLFSIISKYPKWYKQLMFHYDGNDRLIYTDVIAVDNYKGPCGKKLINVYEYDSADNLVKIINHETKAAAYISYNNNSAYRIANGVINGGKLKLGEYSVETEFIEKTYQNVEGVSLRTDKSLKEVKIVNERGVASYLQFNTKSENISSFELDGAYKRTLSKEYGVKVALGGSGSDTINDEKTKRISSGNVLNLTLSNQLTTRKGEDEYLNYSLSVWVKLYTGSKKRIRACATVQDKASYAEIDNTAANVWQKVILPVNFSKKESRKNAAIKFELSDLDGVIKTADICCMRIYPGEGQQLFYNGKNLTNNLLKVTSDNVNYIDINGQSVNLCASNGTYLTQNDLLRAATEPAKVGSSYDLICCGGTKRIANVRALQFDCEDLLTLNYSEKLYFETKTPDNNVRTRQYLSPCKLSDGTGLAVKQETVSYKNGINGKASSDDVKSSKSIEYDKYGRVKSECDPYGIITDYLYDDSDVNGLNYGNIKKKVISNPDYLEEMLVYEYKYDENGEMITQSTDGITSQGIVRKGGREVPDSIVFGGKDDFNKLVTSSGAPLDGKRRVKYKYDGLYEKLLSLTETGGSITKQHTFTYENGVLRTITDGAFKYGIKSDLLNDKVDFTVFDDETEISMLTKQTLKYDSVSGYSGTRAQYHNEADKISGTSEISMDKYGRLKASSYSGQNSNGNVQFLYQASDGESAAAGRLSNVSDNFERKNYKYNYDEKGALVGWEQRKTDGGNFISVRQLSHGETKYSIGLEKNGIEQYVPEKYKTKITYDEKCAIEPRINATSVFYDSVYDDDENDWKELREYSKMYSYDEFGRLKEGIVYNHKITGGETIAPRQTYVYEYDDKYDYGEENYKISLQVKKYKYLSQYNINLTNAEIDFEYEYDENGRLKTVKRKDSGSSLPASEEIHNYVYDIYGHVIQQKKNGRVSNFSYDKNGRLTNGRNYYESGKDKGKLSEITGFRFIKYDNYGNVKAFNDWDSPEYAVESFEYERGNLLTKIKRRNANIAGYSYNHKGMRYEKVVNGVTTTYYLDGAKILGEDRTDGKKIRYFYDAQGICGFGYTKDGKTKYYKYVKDLFGNVIMLMTASGEPLVKYEYDTFGTPTAYVCVAKRWFGKNANVTFESAEVRKELWDEPWEIAEINPYRWKSFYYDTESGYYYVSGRYYSPEAGIYLDVEDPEEITENAGITGGLDRNAITLDNYFEIEANSFDIFTQDKLTPDITYDPNENISWWERNWLSVLLIGIQLIVGILLCFIPCAQGIGIQMIFGAIMGGLSMLALEINSGASKVLSDGSLCLPPRRLIR